MLTLLVFALVILIFLKWVERISKLGRLGHTIKIVEQATEKAIHQRLAHESMAANFTPFDEKSGTAIFNKKIGYVQHINMQSLQEIATEIDAQMILKCSPGTFCSPDKPLAYLNCTKILAKHRIKIESAFKIDDSRSFYDDPRFGIIALSEIGSRALSPGINDPGTAIAIINSQLRLLNLWISQKQKSKPPKIAFDRIKIPMIMLNDILEDAFRPIARDGAANLEVMIKLQKTLAVLANRGTQETKVLTTAFSKQAFERAELAMKYATDLAILKQEALYYQTTKEN